MIPVIAEDVQIGSIHRLQGMYVWKPNAEGMAKLGVDLRAPLVDFNAESMLNTVHAMIQRQRKVLASGKHLTDEDRDPLDPELRPYITDSSLGHPCLRHPLVFMIPYHGHTASICNAVLEDKKQQSTQAMSAEDWDTFIGLYEKPYRINALSFIAFDLSDEDYWRLVGSVWTMVENIHEDFDLWAELWSDGRPGRLEHAMDEDERTAFDALPPVIEIYRGYRHEEYRFGMSWTTNRDKAMWFARRSRSIGHSAYLATAKVNKDDVLAYFLGRDESEIVVLPENLLGVRQEVLEQHTEKEELG